MKFPLCTVDSSTNSRRSISEPKIMFQQEESLIVILLYRFSFTLLRRQTFMNFYPYVNFIKFPFNQHSVRKELRK